MNRTNWKSLERSVAKDVGGKRILRKGESVPDVEVADDDIIIDCKKSRVRRINEWIRQVNSYKKAKSNIAIIVYQRTGGKLREVYISSNDLYKLLKKCLHKNKLVVRLEYRDFVSIIKEACDNA